MKSILEKALVHLLNEEHEQAQELFHQFVVSRAKEIHESLREGDEMGDDNLTEEEFFTEADLEDAEAADHLSDDLDDSTVADTDLTADTDMDADATDADAQSDDADMTSDVDDADMSGDDDLGGRLSDIEDEIKALQAEFDRVMAEFDGEDTDGDDMNADADGEAVVNTAVDTTDTEDFDDVTESMVSDLKTVSVPNVDGRGANGEKLDTKTSDKSATPPKGAGGAKPIVGKGTVGHTGFEREKAPAAKSGPDRGRAYTNDRKKATDGNSLMPASGPKGAELAKPIAGNTKSAIPGRKPGSK